MIELNNPVTGHQIRTDDESVDFWSAAGYQVKPEPKKAPAKKAAAKKSSK